MNGVMTANPSIHLVAAYGTSLGPSMRCPNRIFTFCKNTGMCSVYSTTAIVDIFACIHFREFAKNGNFAQIFICIFDIAVSIWPNKSSFHDVHIFPDI